MKNTIIILFLFFALQVSAQKKTIITTDQVAIPTSPFSQAVKANGFIFVSGQIGQTKERKLVEGGFLEELKQIMENIKVILIASGSGMDDIVSTTVYLKDINNFSLLNDTYKTYFKGNYPARTTIGVASLPGNAQVEIAVTAIDKKVSTNK